MAQSDIHYGIGAKNNCDNLWVTELIFNTSLYTLNLKMLNLNCSGQQILDTVLSSFSA